MREVKALFRIRIARRSTSAYFYSLFGKVFPPFKIISKMHILAYDY